MDFHNLWAWGAFGGWGRAPRRGRAPLADARDVYNLGIVGSAADYVHRAGRVGRVGQLARGTVTSVLCAAEVGEYLALGRTLRFAPVEKAAPMAEELTEELSLEAKVQALADSFYLYGDGVEAEERPPEGE